MPKHVSDDLLSLKKRESEDVIEGLCIAIHGYSQGVPFKTATIEWVSKSKQNLHLAIHLIFNGIEVLE
ncbi:hypothetical protein AFZ21_15695 [Listeria monocytogenes]|uniref:hypothetical protein n=1 Tax=Listeria monocytogenes TaxID=1639 RepID=UPI000BE0E105|nr:hypothetical protein [Listeria monocytogenes]PDK72807.1 hypothetical protein AFZ21_15695 [Listeria monocytogenes]PDK75886.1 hypothetical protein AFZ20_15675 [Listeria monocytogenes]